VPSKALENLQHSPPRLLVVVKDLFRIKGLKTSLNNKAYYDLSVPADSTSTVVESLARDGAHILGMAKLSHMIGREEPLDAVDFHTAFNPRGDGYQSPAGSSSSSAAAVAAYDWIHCGIGTDTSGSGRRPALANSVWQFHPSHHLVDSTGMVTTYPVFDAPCIFTRELQVLNTALKSWVLPNKVINKPNEKDSYEIIYLVDYLPVTNQERIAVIDSFLGDAATHLPTTIKKTSIREMWKSSHPDGTPNEIDEYLADLVARTFYYGFYHSSDTFRSEYAKANDGAIPYVILSYSGDGQKVQQ